MWNRVLHRVLTRLIRKGQLTVEMADGTQTVYEGTPGHSGFVRIVDTTALRALCLNPTLALGECYMDGALEIPEDQLLQTLSLLVENMNLGDMPVWYSAMMGLRTGLRRFMQRNTPEISRRNVAHHYDISDDLYALFLDQDMQYSCGYFTDPQVSLENAQIAKKRHIAEKLLLQPGMKVLDIGCGWGGLSITLAKEYDARVTGVTLSQNQLATAQARVAAEGLTDRIDLRLQDYRLLNETYDRIVSVGMLEHVGFPQLNMYFRKVAELLSEDGVALIHSITKAGPPAENNAWINKYIFPGSYAPAGSEVHAAIDRNGLVVADVESWRLHYSYTLREWHRRFQAQAQTIIAQYDDRFYRMFTFYLVSMQASFMHGRMMVQQFQISKGLGQVNVTRDYLYRSAPS